MFRVAFTGQSALGITFVMFSVACCSPKSGTIHAFIMFSAPLYESSVAMVMMRPRRVEAFTC